MSTRLTPERYRELLKSDAERIAAVVDSADPTAHVEACPDWAIGDLVYHVGRVHEFWCFIASERLQVVDDDTHIPRGPDPDDADLGPWLVAGAERLAEALDADSATTMWSWTSQHDLAFAQRRMAQETAVHRWDAEHAVGRENPIAADLAADGIDEFFFLATAYPPTQGRERVRLRATDIGGVWVADVVDGIQVLTPGEGDADAELAGSASDLLLVLWRRLPVDAVTRSGSAEAVTSMLARAALG